MTKKITASSGTTSRLPRCPLMAQSQDLAACLSIMGAKPLKLVAEKVVPAFKEESWKKGRWKHRARSGSLLSRDLLPFGGDTFQFSVANQHSKQDFHRHRKVVEIVVSSHRITICWEAVSGRSVAQKPVRKKTTVGNGALIIPPGLWHQLELEGFAWVFQAVVGSGAVHDDKEIRTRRATTIRGA